jgi:hypothetical protein
MNEDQIALITEQIKHGLDLMQAELRAMRTQQEHDRQMVNQRLEELEELSRDHETRLRAATDGVVQFKVWSGGSSLISLAALVRTFLGG